MSTKPAIEKARFIRGKTLVFRDASVSDAAFILALRTDEKKSRYLSKVSPDRKAQIAWLEDYRRSTNQAYFIIEFEGHDIGTVRLYDPQGESFCWGSWILADSRPKHAAVESALMVYAYATDHLGFTGAHFEVHKRNERVWQFHERMGATRVAETARDYFYRFEQDAIRAARRDCERFLPGGVRVEQ